MMKSSGLLTKDIIIPENYTSSPEIIKNCLQEVLSEGMMCSQVNAPADNDDMTKKQYYNMAIINRQSLEYLVELEEIPANHYSEFKINASLFTPETPKETEQEVFSEEEEKKFKALALKEFKEHPDRIAALAVIINFSLGLRVGELVALKWKDLTDSYLHIREWNRNSLKSWKTTNGRNPILSWNIPNQTPEAGHYMC